MEWWLQAKHYVAWFLQLPSKVDSEITSPLWRNLIFTGTQNALPRTTEPTSVAAGQPDSRALTHKWCRFCWANMIIQRQGRNIDGDYVELNSLQHTGPDNDFTYSVRKHLLKPWIGTSSVDQWLRRGLPVQGVWVSYLVGELRSHRPKTQNRRQAIV